MWPENSGFFKDFFANYSLIVTGPPFVTHSSHYRSGPGHVTQHSFNFDWPAGIFISLKLLKGAKSQRVFAIFVHSQGTSINDVRRFSTIFDLPTYLRPILIYLPTKILFFSLILLRRLRVRILLILANFYLKNWTLVDSAEFWLIPL